MVQVTPQAGTSSIFGPRNIDQIEWQEWCDKFLNAVPNGKKDQISILLHHVHNSTPGIRDWVSLMMRHRSPLPQSIPDELIDVYLADPQALPLYDCEGCGIAIPIRPNPLYGLDGDPDIVYFEKCPICQSRTGLYLRFTRQYEESVASLKRRRPR